MIPDSFTNVSVQLRTRCKLVPTARTAGSSSVSSQYYQSPDWWRLRAAIMKALQDFPEARDSVVRALRALDAEDPHDSAY